MVLRHLIQFDFKLDSGILQTLTTISLAKEESEAVRSEARAVLLDISLY